MTEDISARVADQLAEAHRRVRRLDVAEDEKARATRRLLAISEASKHDVDRAARRLDVFLKDLEEGRIASSDRDEPL